MKSMLHDICEDIAKAVENAIIGLVGKPEASMIIQMGADGTFTEKMDKVAEDAALSVLEKKSIQVKLISEELGERTIGKPEFTVLLDPIDGTFNAVNNLPFFCVSIAIGNSNLSDIRYGYVRNLVNGDTFTAEKGKGAFLNNRRIHVSSTSRIDEMSIVSYTHSYDNKKVKRIRVLGSAALELCYVASGVFDAFIDMRGMLRITDMAAGKLIVEEAGGMVTDERGKPLLTSFDVRQRVNIIASNGLAHDKLLELV